MKKNRLFCFLLILILVIVTNSFSTPKIKPVSKILIQEDSPIKILSYEAGYSVDSRGIKHTVNFKNLTPRKIVAVEFIFISFDIWNDFLHKISCTRIEDIDGLKYDKDGKESEYSYIPPETWVDNCYADFNFHAGFAYIKRVRFEDDQFWKADENIIFDEIKRIETSFDKTKMEDKKE